MPNTSAPPPPPEAPARGDEARVAEETARNVLSLYGIKRPSAWEVTRMIKVLREAEERGAARERALCLADIEGERLTGETGVESDLAYNRALADAKHAILNRAPVQTETIRVNTPEAFDGAREGGEG